MTSVNGGWMTVLLAGAGSASALPTGTWPAEALPAEAAPVQAVTIEGRTIEGTWTGVDAAGAIVLDHEGRKHALMPADLVVLRWADAKPVTPTGDHSVFVFLADGSRIRARIIEGDARHIRIASGPRPQWDLPLRKLAAVLLAARPHPAAHEAFLEALEQRGPSEDVLLVVRDDRVTALRGATESLGPQGGSFRWRDRSVPIKLDAAYGVVFAAATAPPPRAAAVCELRDGSAWAGNILGGSPGLLNLELTDGAHVALPIPDIAEIRFHSDKVVFLSDLRPAAYEFEPFWTTRWPYRVNRSVANRPLRIGDQTFERGIGMHSQAMLVYTLDQPFSQLAAVIGIDEAAGPLGHVIFRVIADGQEAFNSGPVTGRDAPRPILVPIGGARELRLVVDFGDDLDIGDQADWGNVRLIQ